MNHRVFGRKLSRTKNERRRLLQGLSRDLILHGAITTTLAKAKAVQPLVEKLITKAKDGSSASVNRIRQILVDKKSVDRLMSDAKSRFLNRTSGYTSIIKLAPRISDQSHMAYLSFVDTITETEVVKKKVPVKKIMKKK